MAGWLSAMLRRARMRNLAEGSVQAVRTEATDDDTKDGVERWQDYGLAANPGDGQGLVLNIDGHTIVMRLDRIAERPQLAVYEVALWHKEGHYVKLKAGKVIEVSCEQLLINATTKVSITTPTFEVHCDQATIGATSTATVTAPNVAVNASSGVAVTTPTLNASQAVSVGTTLSAGIAVEAPTVTAQTSLTVDSKEVLGHTHGNVENGPGHTDPL
jgi:phage gp45-like